MKNEVVKVDSEFSKLLPKPVMSAAEMEIFKNRLSTEAGFARLIVWEEEGILLDNKMKYQVCKDHNLPYEVTYLSLPNRQAAKQWIAQDQLQKPNLSKWNRVKVVVKCWADEFEALAKNNQRLSKGRGKTNTDSVNLNVDVTQMLADKAGVCKDTTRKARFILADEKTNYEEIALLEDETLSIETAYWAAKRKKKEKSKANKAKVRHNYANELTKSVENQVLCMDVLEGIKLIPDSSLDLGFTSPPFNCKKKYTNCSDNKSWKEYFSDQEAAFKALKPKFRKGGRLVIEIEEVTMDKKDRTLGYKMHTEAMIKMMLIDLGYLYVQTIIWDKTILSSPRILGSYRSPSSPVILPIHSFILVFAVDSYTLPPATDESSELSKAQWNELTQSIWRVEREHRGYGCHPCPMPVKLAENAILLLSHKGGLVADIYGGSATTAIACIRNGRKYVHIDNSKTYCHEAKERIEKEMKKIEGNKSKKPAA